jgi:hypothetical protein
MMKKKTWILLSVILAIDVGLVAGVWNRLEKVESGVCEEAGRVLTKVELRQAVLQSLVDYTVDNTNILYGPNTHIAGEIGIIRNHEFSDFIELMWKAAQSDTRTFEENFGLEKIAFRKGPFDISSLRDPFVLMRYDPETDGVAGFYASSLIWEAGYNRRLSLYRKLLGYGKYYFHVPHFAFLVKCCDKKFPRKKREDVYASNFRSIAERYEFPRDVVPVSNCGKLLTERENDTGLHLYQLVYLEGE